MVVRDQIYEYNLEKINGGEIHFQDYKDKKILIVNLDPYGEYSPQITQLLTLHTRYKDKVVLIGIPANVYGREEPASNKNLVEVFSKKYGLTFPVAATHNHTDERIHPVHKWLLANNKNHFPEEQVSWHFQKYLINEFGKLEAVFPPGTSPLSEEVISAVEATRSGDYYNE